MRDEAGDRGLTVAKALHLIEDNELRVDRRTVIVVDEASMVGTPQLGRLLEASTAGRAKIVLVGDAYQLAPVKARGGMFEQLCEDLPWSQRLGEVWRMRDPAERDASLALRSARGNRLRKAIGWYRNRWRVLGVDVTNKRIAAERLTDQARVVFEGDYLREHITLGYAGTVASAQGVTIGRSNQYGVCWTILSDRASRAMAYVGMTRGRDENHLAIYPAVTNEAHHHDTETGIHRMHRGTKHAAAHALHAILTVNDDRAATMHTVAARTDRELLPTIVAALLDRNDQRCAERAQAWRRHTAQDRARDAAFERIAATTQQAAHRARSRGRGYGLEL